MRKKLLSAILALVMVVSLLPMTVFADDADAASLAPVAAAEAAEAAQLSSLVVTGVEGEDHQVVSSAIAGGPAASSAVALEAVTLSARAEQITIKAGATSGKVYLGETADVINTEVPVNGTYVSIGDTATIYLRVAADESADTASAFYSLTVNNYSETPEPVLNYYIAAKFGDGYFEDVKDNSVLWTGNSIPLVVVKMNAESVEDATVIEEVTGVAWSSTNDACISVDSSGYMKALRPTSETVHITATVDGTTLQVGFTVTLRPDPTKITKVWFDANDKTSYTLDVQVGVGTVFTRVYLTAKTDNFTELVEMEEVSNSKRDVAEFTMAGYGENEDGTLQIILGFTAKNPGSTKIKVSVGGKNVTVTVKVTQELQIGWFTLAGQSLEGVTVNPDTHIANSPISFGYTGSAQKPKVALTPEAKAAGVKFKTKYTNNKDIGTATVTITGTGSYVGEIILKFSIDPVDFSDENQVNTISVKVKDKTYNGQPNPAKVTLKVNKKTLKQGIDYEVTYKKDGTTFDAPVDAGTYTLVITGKDGSNYTGSFETSDLDEEVTYTIKRAALSKMKVKMKTTYKLVDGAEAISLDEILVANGFTVKFGSEVLDAGEDYTVEIKDKATGATVEDTHALGVGKYIISVKPVGNNFDTTKKEAVTKNLTVKA